MDFNDFVKIHVRVENLSPEKIMVFPDQLFQFFQDIVVKKLGRKFFSNFFIINVSFNFPRIDNEIHDTVYRKEDI